MKHINRFNEMIKVDIKVGDTVLGGRFKNKKIVVKKIGKNKKGDITINDKPLLKFRIIKEGFENDVVDYLSHLIDDGFIVEQREDFVRIFKPKYGDFYAYTNLQEFNFSEIDGDIIRFVKHIGDEFNGPEFTEHDYVIKSVMYMTQAETPRNITKNGSTFIDQLDRNVIDIKDIDTISDLNMYSLTIMI